MAKTTEPNEETHRLVRACVATGDDGDVFVAGAEKDNWTDGVIAKLAAKEVTNPCVHLQWVEFWVPNPMTIEVEAPHA